MYKDHVLYTNIDNDAPTSIKNRHDDAVLDLCRFCGKGEAELKGPCVNQDRVPNFRDVEGNLFLIRCFSCEPIRGRENNSMAVSSGICAWCDWQDKKEGVNG